MRFLKWTCYPDCLTLNSSQRQHQNRPGRNDYFQSAVYVQTALAARHMDSVRPAEGLCGLLCLGYGTQVGLR